LFYYKVKVKTNEKGNDPDLPNALPDGTPINWVGNVVGDWYICKTDVEIPPELLNLDRKKLIPVADIQTEAEAMGLNLDDILNTWAINGVV
jgi:hypothetical protein